MADIHDIGKAMMSWMTGQVGAAAAGADSVTLTMEQYGGALDVDDLTALLVPNYIAHIPPSDAWGHDYDYHVKTDNLLGARVMLIRSTGADGVLPPTTRSSRSSPPPTARTSSGPTASSCAGRWASTPTAPVPDYSGP